MLERPDDIAALRAQMAAMKADQVAERLARAEVLGQTKLAAIGHYCQNKSKFSDQEIIASLAKSH